MNDGSPGTVVLLAERGELGPAWVTAREGTRFVLQNLLGERFAVSPQRLFWVGRKVLASADTMPEYWAEVQALAAGLEQGLDLERAWRDAPDAGISTLAAVALGKEGPAAEDAIALTVFRDSTFYRMKERQLVRESAESVTDTLTKKRERLAAQSKLDAAITGFRAGLAGTPCVLDPDYLAGWLDVAAHGRESTKFTFIEPHAKALQLPLSAPAHAAFDLLVRLGQLAPDANLAPLKAGVQLVFSAEALAEAERLVAHPPTPTSKDLTHLPAIAIDDPDTTEVDDAVAWDPNDPDRLQVMIADAAAWVAPGSLLDKVAFERVSTLYLPEGKVPMLPPAIAEDAASLVQDAVRGALVFSFRIDPDGRVRDLDVVRAKVRVAHTLTYDVADQLITQPDGSTLATTLSAVDKLIARHRDGRHARGAITFQRPEVYYVREADGTVRPKIGDPLGPARQLVSELMVATCAAAAEFCVDRAIPCLYRTQAPPDEPAPVADPKTGRIDDPTRQYELLRRLKPSALTTTASSHFTLAVSAYTQLTSPIRRYADLVMHQQLVSFLRSGRPAYSAKNLEAMIFEIGRRAGLVKRVESESRRFFALRWLTQNPGQTLDARVLREVGKKTLVEIEKLNLQELVHLRKRRHAGDQLRLLVVSADARKDSLEVREVS